MVCQDNNNLIDGESRGGRIKCPDDSIILINSAELEISSKKDCPSHYILNADAPTCSRLLDNDVLKYLTSM